MIKSDLAIWWIRRDLRLQDNPPLCAAAGQGRAIIPLFILDPEILRSRYHSDAGARRAFLLGGLRSLDADLRKRGGRLILREGRPLEVLGRILQETGAGLVYAAEDYSPYSLRRDAEIAGQLPLRLMQGVSIIPPAALLKADGRPYTVFTPFSRAWKAQTLPLSLDILSAPEKLSTPPDVGGEDIPDGAATETFVPGESAARNRLELFMRGPVFHYAESRDQLAAVGTSQLSPYFRFGMLSAREAFVIAQNAIRSAEENAPECRNVEKWIRELIWREFYISVLFHFPHVLGKEFSPTLRRVKWRKDAAQLRSWQQGSTGYPLVDAGMRELLGCGWMHNRARMMVASFLVKDLLIDWHEGESWFMRHLIDGDPAANNGGWQWAAGTGTDATPYFRIFNPVLQGRRFDPKGTYIRTWVPELERVPLRYVHSPWEMPVSDQWKAGCRIGKDYPAPIVDHAQARERALEAYQLTVDG